MLVEQIWGLKVEDRRSTVTVTGNKNVKNRFSLISRQKWIDLRQTKTKMINGPRIYGWAANMLLISVHQRNRRKCPSEPKINEHPVHIFWVWVLVQVVRQRYLVTRLYTRERKKSYIFWPR